MVFSTGSVFRCKAEGCLSLIILAYQLVDKKSYNIQTRKWQLTCPTCNESLEYDESEALEADSMHELTHALIDKLYPGRWRK